MDSHLFTQFAWPWMLLLLPLPLLLSLGDKRAQKQSIEGAALVVPFAGFRQQLQGRTSGHSGTAHSWLSLLPWFIWLALLLAAARPQWVGEAVALPTSGRDMMLAIDLSGSMKEEDFQAAGRMINRLTAAKAVADDFIKRRVGDRIGLILFGSQPYLQAPLTPDRETLRTFLWEAQIGMAGQNTAIGDAIGMAIKQLKDHPANERVLILMTDGANTTGRLDPIKAADIAAEYGLKIYTIGMGADEILVRSLFGSRRVNPSRDLDEKTLKAVAEKTGGRYFRAHNFKELEQIYALLDELEPIKQDKLFYRPVKELFFWPAAIALLLLLLWPPLRAARGANT